MKNDLMKCGCALGECKCGCAMGIIIERVFEASICVDNYLRKCEKAI